MIHKNDKTHKKTSFLGMFVLAAGIMFSLLGGISLTAKAAGKEVVIVIDPGHGGSNEGAQINGMFEKDITMVTALAMKEELEKYEGVKVYLTRDADIDLTLAQRAQIAADLQADFLYCLHYNMSAPHNLFGSEVWIPSAGTGYVKGYAAGDLVLNELCDGYGLYRRGIKTKLGSTGEDYYGILRQSVLRGVPAVLVEHCHMDHINDAPFYNSIEKMQQMGRLDATAAAKYFQLKSTTLGVDYTGYPRTVVSAPAVPAMQDLTPPESVNLSLHSVSEGKAQITIQAVESQSQLLYYDYSSDGGITWSPLQKWNVGSVSTSAAIPVNSAAANKTILVRVYNNYDLAAQSNGITY